MAGDEDETPEDEPVFEKVVDRDPSAVNKRVLTRAAILRLNELKDKLSQGGLLPRKSKSPAIVDPPRQYGIVTHFLLDDRKLVPMGEGQAWRGIGKKEPKFPNTRDYELMSIGFAEWSQLMYKKRFYDWDGVMRKLGIDSEHLLNRLETNIPGSKLGVTNLAKTLGLDVPRKYLYAFYVVPVSAKSDEIEALARTYNVKPKRKK